MVFVTSSQDITKKHLLKLEILLYFIFLFRLTVSYTEVVYPARILPNQSGKPVPETQKLAECIFDCRTLLQQILTDGLTVLQNSKPAPSYQQHKAGLSKQP